MRCIFCNFLDTQVSDSRPLEDGVLIKRRRSCPSCGGRFTTFEKVEIREIIVIKKNNKQQQFDGKKLLRSLEIAVRKRPIDRDHLEMIVEDIHKSLSKFSEDSVDTKTIGQFVINKLAALDHISCIRYASVYYAFEKAEDFVEFINNSIKNLGV